MTSLLIINFQWLKQDNEFPSVLAPKISWMERFSRITWSKITIPWSFADSTLVHSKADHITSQQGIPCPCEGKHSMYEVKNSGSSPINACSQLSSKSCKKRSTHRTVWVSFNKKMGEWNGRKGTPTSAMIIEQPDQRKLLFDTQIFWITIKCIYLFI